MLSENRRFYTIRELIEAGYGSRSTVYRHAKAGLLPAIKLPSGKVIVPKAEFEEYMAKHRLDLVMGEPAEGHAIVRDTAVREAEDALRRLSPEQRDAVIAALG